MGPPQPLHFIYRFFLFHPFVCMCKISIPNLLVPKRVRKTLFKVFYKEKFYSPRIPVIVVIRLVQTAIWEYVKDFWLKRFYLTCFMLLCASSISGTLITTTYYYSSPDFLWYCLCRTYSFYHRLLHKASQLIAVVVDLLLFFIFCHYMIYMHLECV